MEGDCLQAATYSGEVCRETFVSMQTCFSGEASPLNIPSRIDQEAGERNARNLVDGLLLLGPSLQCREAILPFLCLSTFTLCDTSNNLHTILREDCLELRDNICAEEWSRAVAILGRGVLPDCEQLPNDTDRCIGRFHLWGISVIHEGGSWGEGGNCQDIQGGQPFTESTDTSHE